MRGHARGRRRAARPAPPGRRDRRAAATSRSARRARTRSRCWEDQRIFARPRYRDLIAALRFVARQEVIFGLHVHVGIDDADKAIHVANGMRVHVPVLLALSANSPFWRGQAPASPRPGCRSSASSRASACRPPTTTGRTSRSGSASWSSAKTIEDYTYLWYDVRPHPNFGTVEIRAMDGQTRVEHTLGAGGADPGDGQGAGRALRGRRAARRLPVRDARREPLGRRPPRPRRRDGRLPASSASPTQGARAAALRPARRARAGPRLRRRSSRGSTTCSSAATARIASAWSTRPTTIFTRSCARSRKPRVPE